MLFPRDVETKILPALAHALLHAAVALIFVVAILSAILSTIDSAILSPASVLAQNVFPRFGEVGTLKSNRVAVLAVALCSLLVAYAGESAYQLLGRGSLRNRSQGGVWLIFRPEYAAPRETRQPKNVPDPLILGETSAHPVNGYEQRPRRATNRKPMEPRWRRREVDDPWEASGKTSDRSDSGAECGAVAAREGRFVPGLRVVNRRLARST